MTSFVLYMNLGTPCMRLPKCTCGFTYLNRIRRKYSACAFSRARRATKKKTSRPIVRINSRGRVAITKRTDADRREAQARGKERTREANAAVRRILAMFFGNRQAYRYASRALHKVSVGSLSAESIYVAKRSERVPRHALPHAEA